jgi:hypothetical protein
MPSTRHICAIGALLTALTACGSATADPSTPFTPRPNADDLFMMALTHFGIRVTADNIPKTIAVGHQVCTYIGQGHTPMEAVHEVASNNADYTHDNAGEFVGRPSKPIARKSPSSNGQRPSMDGRPWTPPVIRHRTHTLGGPCRSRPTQLITAYVLP